MSPSVFSGTSSSLNLVRRLGPKVLLSLLVLELLLDGQDAGCRRDQQQELLHEWYSFVQLVAGHRHAGRCWPTLTRVSDFFLVREAGENVSAWMAVYSGTGLGTNRDLGLTYPCVAAATRT